MVGVSSRTRSKKVALFSSFSLDCSSSKRKKSDEDVMSLESVSGSKRRRVKNESFVFPKNDEVIFIDEDHYYEDGLEHCDVDVKKEGKIDEKCGWERENPITIEEDDEDFVGSDESDEDDDSDDSEENDTSDEDFNVGEVNEVSDNDDESSSDSSFVDDEEEEVEEEEVEVEGKKKKASRKYFNVVEQLAREVNDEISREEEEKEEEKKKKGSRESFNVVEELIREVNDEKSGEEVEKEKKVNEIFDSDDGNSNDVDNDEEEVREEKKENGISESDGSSNDVIVDDDDDEEEEEKGLREPNNVVEEVSREVNDDKIGEEEEKEKKKVDEIFGNDDGSSNDVIVDDVEEKVRDEEKKGIEEDLDPLWQEYNNCLMEEEEQHLSEVKDKKSGISKRSNNQKKKIVYNKEVEHSDYGSATASTTFNPMKGSSSKRNETSENVRDEEKKGLRKPNNVVEEDEEEVREDLDPLWQEYDNGLMEKGSSSKRNEASSETHKAKSIEGFESKGQKQFESKGRDKKESKDNNGLNQRGKNAYFTSKDLSLVKLLAECYSNKKSSMNNDPILLEVNSDHDDDVNPLETRKPPVCVETPLIWSLKKVQEVELTEEEEEEERRNNEALNPIWDEMFMYINESEAESKIGNLGTNEATQENNGSASSRCEHVTIYDEEIGVYCKLCGEVITESKYMTQLVRDKYPYEGYEKRASLEDSGNASRFDYSQSQFNASDGDLDANFCHKKGTVWDLIPEVKETLYPHQQEGFEVIWKNLAGSINRKKLKNADPEKEGGCIISHAPGTGKTRLTIVFLMAYLKVFPKCFPVIVAPAGLLHTWEDEFRKWNIGVPFHNLNNPELSGKEHEDAVNELNWSSAQNTMVDTRMVKLISWYKETSILGISYTLYKELAGTVESENEKTKNQASTEKRKEMGKFLRNVPGLLVLDEGHTPRNKRSGIWKVFSEIPTKKRIILSGTPFQNNCLELYNTLSLVKPSFPNMLPHELKKFCQKQEHKKVSKELSWEPVFGNSTTENPSDDKIQQLKLLMDPFVHVHKGAILQKTLPGLKNCVLTLKPDGFHKKILESFESSQNTMIFENKQTLASIHPSLFLECTLTEQEESAVDKDRLEKLRLNHNAGVKTRFLVEFVNLCAAANEKVLVFSQFLRPLHLIIDQLSLAFEWTKDEEILYMDGQIKDRQSLIHRFNDANSQAKVLLASTKACCEGISLVGASRVVLLDVEWNPAVEKQAISRAYRIGQKKFVYIYHLLTQGTRECDKYCKQIEKHRLSELIFSAKNADNNDESKSRASNIEDTILDKMIWHENLKDLFVDCKIQVEGARI